MENGQQRTGLNTYDFIGKSYEEQINTGVKYGKRYEKFDEKIAT